MRTLLLAAAALSLTAAAAPKLQSPADIVAAAPPSAWKTIPADDLMVIDLANGGRVVVQLAPQFTPIHVANVRALARANFWNGATVYRVQDNYVAQWGQNDSGKPWPTGVVANPPKEYQRSLRGLTIKPLGSPDPYAPAAGFVDGWPVGFSNKGDWAALAHCYGTVGAGRDLEDSGTGAELYAVIGHAPRHMDRNLAVVGRVVDGIENLSALPRGTEALGFYKEKGEAAPISAVRLASMMPAAQRPSYQFMDTGSPSFARYLQLRSHRNDDFYRQPAAGVDLCNVQVPVRKRPAGA